MSDNPNIERVSFEEIQEFKDLNLFNLPAVASPDNLIMLVYDTRTSSFLHAKIDALGGGVVFDEAKLTKDVTVNTEKLPVNSGYVFLQGTSFTDVLDILCNPPTDSTLTAAVDRDIIEYGIGVPRVLSYTFDMGTETGPIDVATVEYFRGATLLPSQTDSLAITSGDEVVYTIKATAPAAGATPLKAFQSSVIMRVVIPTFIGLGQTAVPTNDKSLQDIKKDGYIICDFTDVSNDFDFYWFAVDHTFVPKRWAEIDEQGHETGTNKGGMDLLFEPANSFVYTTNTFFSYRTLDKKVLPLRIKIYF